jgi:succinate dehydrogenase / fumarate reductase cytochrome b subunit
MIISGAVILAFVVFHLSHFTFGWIQPELCRLTDAEGRHDVYSMVTLGFESWGISAFYVVGLLFLCSHLSHAAFSAFQTLGAGIGCKDTPVKRVAGCLALATVLGFASVPVAVLLGWFGAS